MRNSSRTASVAADKTCAPRLPLDSAPIQVISGSMLCRLCVWTDAEWDALSPKERPRDAVYAPGLGWVGAAPVESLN